MKILTNPNPILRKPSTSYAGNFDNDLQTLIQEMFEIMQKNKGIGLSAPQIGINEQLMVMQVNKEKHVLINPEITRKSLDLIEVEEGCLSVPKTWGKVKRAARIKIKARNQFGKKISLKAENLLAVVVQHEIDHLNGILFIDRANPKTIKHEESKSSKKI